MPIEDDKEIFVRTFKGIIYRRLALNALGGVLFSLLMALFYAGFFPYGTENDPHSSGFFFLWSCPLFVICLSLIGWIPELFIKNSYFLRIAKYSFSGVFIALVIAILSSWLAHASSETDFNVFPMYGWTFIFLCICPFLTFGFGLIGSIKNKEVRVLSLLPSLFITCIFALFAPDFVGYKISAMIGVVIREYCFILFIIFVVFRTIKLNRK